MSWGGCQKRNGLPWLSARGVPLSLKVLRSHPWRMLRPAYDVDIGHSKLMNRSRIHPMPACF